MKFIALAFMITTAFSAYAMEEKEKKEEKRENVIPQSTWIPEKKERKEDKNLSSKNMKKNPSLNEQGVPLELAIMLDEFFKKSVDDFSKDPSVSLEIKEGIQKYFFSIWTIAQQATKNLSKQEVEDKLALALTFLKVGYDEHSATQKELTETRETLNAVLNNARPKPSSPLRNQQWNPETSRTTTTSTQEKKEEDPSQNWHMIPNEEPGKLSQLNETERSPYSEGTFTVPNPFKRNTPTEKTLEETLVKLKNAPDYKNKLEILMGFSWEYPSYPLGDFVNRMEDNGIDIRSVMTVFLPACASMISENADLKQEIDILKRKLENQGNRRLGRESYNEATVRYNPLKADGYNPSSIKSYSEIGNLGSQTRNDFKPLPRQRWEDDDKALQEAIRLSLLESGNSTDTKRTTTASVEEKSEKEEKKEETNIT